MKKIKSNQQVKDSTGSDVVIRVENLTKEYRLGVINHGMLHQDLQSWWARVRGKEDPNSLISSGQHSSLLNDNPHLLALDDVSFDVKQGEILGIIGRNGAGKSTLLKILSRVTAPTKGTIKIKGRVASLLEVGTGFHPELTGRENVYLNGAILGMTRGEINKKFDEIVAFGEIEKFIDTPVKRYSSGMYVRLAFAVAAHLDPEILVVDEVLAVGDVEFQKKCLGKIGDVARGGRTVLFVSHNLAAISSLCSRAILLVDGKRANDGAAADVVSQYMELVLDTTGSSYHCCEEQNGRAWIVSAELKSDKGEKSSMFLMTEPIILECEINLKEKADLTLSVQIKEVNDSPIYHFPNGDSSFVMPASPGSHKIRVRIPPLYLYPGRYLLRLALTDTVAKTQEEVEKISFDIKQDYQLCTRLLPRQAGLIFSVPKWSGG